MNGSTTKTHPATQAPGAWGRALPLAALAALLIGGTGCTTVLAPISGIPAHRVPCQFLGEPKANYVPVDFSRLRRDPPAEYLLGAKDVLGIWVVGVLGREEEPPPVHFPEDGNRSPALGYPIPVRDDDTISLPLIPVPMVVTGLTLTETEERIRNEYVRRGILKADNARVIVTLIRPRTYQVVVIRQDQQGGAVANNLQNLNNFVRGGLQGGSSRVVNLRAYENDVMHALAETGGLPGLDARNEVKIVRGKFADAAQREQYLRELWQKERGNHCDRCICPPPLAEDPKIIKIPLRLPPGEFLDVTEEDIILQDGDIVVVEPRETEVFYTGGMLPGREIPLPRDYDLDVLGAIALAGGSLHQNIGGTGFSSGLGGAAPTDAVILRPLACGGQITITVDLTRAVNDPATRILMQPRDTLLLRYKPREELVNFGIATFFIQGIQRIFNNN